MDCKLETVYRIRAFNRFYLPSLSLLGEHYLGSEYSIPEARVFFELYERPGCTAALIAKAMNIDKSYLSRILKAHEKSGYLRRQPSPSDGRAYCLFLTEPGRVRAEALIAKSNAEIGAVIAALSEEDCRRLSAALDTVTLLLTKTSEEAVP